MAIQMRRGAKKDFNPDKLKVGEFAVPTDTNEVYIKTSENITKGIATLDDNGKISNDYLNNECINTDKLSDLSVTSDKLSDDSVSTNKLIDNSVTTAKLSNLSVTLDKISDNSISTSKLINNSITTEKIEDLSVTTDKLSDASVSTNKLINNAITTAKIADGSVTTSKIADGSVTTGKLASGASIDKWKNWKHYDGISELNLDTTACTLNDICTAMVGKSRMTFAATFTNYTTLVSELPWNRGQLIIQKYDSWNCHLEFYAEDLPGNTKLHTVKRWIGQWRTTSNLSKFMGWYQMFTESELIPLSAISTGKIQDNLFVAENCTDGGYYRYDTFAWTELTYVSETEFIPCSSNEHFLFYTGQVNSVFHIVFKNSNGEIFTGFRRNSDSNKCIDFVAPPGATSFACAFNTPYKSEIKIGHAAIQQDNLDEYVKSVNNDFFKGKKMNCLGDSITYGYTPGSGTQMERPYPTVVKELLGLDTVRNYGISGSRLANTGSNPIVTRYSDMDDDADIICVFGGTNDWSNNNALGTIDSTDNTTVYGALNELCSGLITKYPKATIFFISPLRRTNDTSANSKGYELKDVQIAIEDVCGKYSIPVLDLYSCGNFYPSNSTQNTQLSGDGLHPNQWYHENILAPKIADFLKQGAISCNGFILTPVPISKGGTGAVTTSEAIANLGVASAIHAHISDDITDNIPISKGGTGSNTVDGAISNLQVVKSGYSSNTPESFALYPHIDGRIKIQLRCLGATGGGQVNSGTPSTSITIAIDKVSPSRYMLYVTCYNNGVSSINTICSNALKINAFNSLGTVSISATDGGNLDNVVQTTLMLGIPY